jgi:hypothetical protein
VVEVHEGWFDESRANAERGNTLEGKKPKRATRRTLA